MKAKPQREGYRVDVFMTLTGTFTEYTGLKTPDTLEMCQALGRGLRRQGAAYRVVKVTGKEKHASEFIEVVESFNGGVPCE